MLPKQLLFLDMYKLGNQLTPVRPDRDDFIRVNEENIVPAMRNQFVKRQYGDAGISRPAYAGDAEQAEEADYYNYLNGYYNYFYDFHLRQLQLDTPYDVLSVLVWEKRLPCFGKF